MPRIVQSSLICGYLDRGYNDSGLMPDDAANRIAVEHRLLRSIALHAPINALTFATANHGAKLKGFDAEGPARRLAQMPNPLARLRLARRVAGRETVAVVEVARVERLG